MEKEEYIKEILIDNAIHLIAEGGFEKATTKNLTFYKETSNEVKMNEVYIYRLFGSKENLYETAFLILDKQFTDASRVALASSWGIVSSEKKKFYDFFLEVWGFLLKNEVRCRCYVRFYYSVYFKGKALEKHQKHFDSIVEAFKPLFIEEADVTAIMHSVFTALLDFAIRFYNGELVDNEINRPHVFNVLYCIMMTYLKNPDTSNVKTLLL